MCSGNWRLSGINYTTVTNYQPFVGLKMPPEKTLTNLRKYGLINVYICCFRAVSTQDAFRYSIECSS